MHVFGLPKSLMPMSSSKRVARIVFFAGAFLIVGSVFILVWQGYQYERLLNQVTILEEEQREWLELNKRIIASIAVFQSPQRIKSIAEGELDLHPIEVSRRIQINLNAGGVDE